jgi:hypothetical protein
MKPFIIIHERLPGLLGVGLCLSLAWAASGAEAETPGTNLPAPASETIDFTRDIKPILDHSCLKCHGAENPKSSFSVTSRESLLRGGSSGKAVQPGQSATSLLIKYVAGLVKDMEMPPPDKGEPLTREQISRLRAWIDQGLVWDKANEAEQRGPVVKFTPYIGGVIVRGNEAKFREDHWQEAGVAGGLMDLEFRQRLNDLTTLTIEARALAPQPDTKLELTLKKRDVGFLRFGAEEYRKYFNDAGGYYSAYKPSQTRLGQDLHVDYEKAWFEVGLTLPEWPKITLGYEYFHQEGSRSTLQWGPMGTLPPESFVTNVKNYYPALRSVDNDLHVIRLAVNYAGRDWSIADDLRVEFGNDRSRRENMLFYNTTTKTVERTISVNEGYRSFVAANSLRVEKQFKDWLQGSLGGMYSHHEGDASFSAFTFSPTANYAGDDRYWQSQSLILKQNMYLGNINLQLGHADGWLLAAALQGETQEQRGFGQVSLDENLLGAFPLFQPANISANNDRHILEERLELRYAGIPRLQLFAEGNFKQENRGLTEELNGSYYEYMRSTDASLHHREGRAGFTASPWSWVSLTTHYDIRERHNSYSHPLDIAGQSFGGFPNEGYSGFITGLDALTQGVNSRLSLKVNRWLKANLGHQWETTTYNTTTLMDAFGGSDGGSLQSGRHEAHTYSAGFTVIPHARFYFSPSFYWYQSQTQTRANDYPAVSAWKGHTYSAGVTGHWVVSEKSSLDTSYHYSRSNYQQHNDSMGLPVGLVYSAHTLQTGLHHQWSERLSASLRYAFYAYDEPISLGLNNYTAHGIFASMQIRFP